MENTLPKITVDSNALSDVDKALKTEWLVTNGLGGYASSTVLGVNTRKYHGLLVAAFNPPTDRRVLLSKLDEEVQVEKEVYQLGANESRSGIEPKGYRFLSKFFLSPFPTFTYVISSLRLSKTVFMPNGKNATVVIYEVTNQGTEKAIVRVKPSLNSRHFHSVTEKEGLRWSFTQKSFENRVTVQPSIPLSALILSSTEGRYIEGEGEWTETHFRADSSRGENSLDHVYQPGFFEVEVSSNESKPFCLLAAAGKDESHAQSLFSSLYRGGLKEIDALLNTELERRQKLLETFQNQHAPTVVEEWLKWLVLAADSFIVHRQSTQTKSVIAGYHWFEDWGRDALISLPGLTLVTGRFNDAREILLTFKHYCRKGLVPNRFPDAAGDKPEYNTVDATLWYFNAVLQYLKYTGDFNFVKTELWETLKSIIERHTQGTLHDIHMDKDCLIEHGPRLTWMDAAINSQPITPRQGRAVEIQALWYNALKIMELLATRFNKEAEAKNCCSMAERAKESFARLFWNPQTDCLFDVVDDAHKDASVRPNQIIAAALDFPILDRARCEKVVEAVQRNLWGVFGLRTLSKDDSRYTGTYMGDRVHRDTAYHNGTVWAWLLGPFTTAFLKLRNHEKEWRDHAFQNFLQPLFQEEVFRAGLGTVSEIFDGDSPHAPQGCVSQAWSVAEPLRAYVEDVLFRRPPYEREVLKSHL